MLHIRADNPPMAAAKWLRKSCPNMTPIRGETPCDIHYRAGLQLPSLPAPKDQP